MKHLFYRNSKGRDYLELFLVAGVATVLLNRLFLYLTGYPSVGGSKYHIAHMLWGGLLLTAGFVMTLTFLGERVRRLSALVGGIGFGLFIDELGKFITRDNNYFFRPTIGLIYVIFMLMFIIFSIISRNTRLTPREYELNALNQLEEAALRDLDVVEKQRLVEVLARADQTSPLVRELRHFVRRLEAVPPPPPGRLTRWLKRVDRAYENFWRRPSGRRLISVTFVGQSIILLLVVLASVFDNFNAVTDIFTPGNSYNNQLLVAELVTSAMSSLLAIAGAYKLFRGSRLEAFEFFRRSLLINLLLTEFFAFCRIQFGALPGFTVNLLLFIALQYAIAEEKRLSLQKARAGK
jgi:hypothetical protein